jgi:G3E family GTPase
MNWLVYCYFLLKVNDWLERLVDEKGEDMYRLKGVISVNESTGRFVFQVSQFIIFPHLLK